MAALKAHVEVLVLSCIFSSFVQMPRNMIARFLVQVFQFCKKLPESVPKWLDHFVSPPPPTATAFTALPAPSGVWVLGLVPFDQHIVVSSCTSLTYCDIERLTYTYLPSDYALSLIHHSGMCLKSSLMHLYQSDLFLLSVSIQRSLYFGLFGWLVFFLSIPLVLFSRIPIPHVLHLL